MSHIVEIQTQVKDPAAIRAACERLRLQPPEQGTHKLFSGEATGLAIKLPGWKYPVVCQPDTGKLQYDNFQENWGSQQRLDEFMQGYAAEKTKLEARRKGHSVTEQRLTDGSIQLTIQVHGSTA